MMTATISRIRLLSSAAEQLIGPLLVFVISYAHHIYFVNNFVSSSFDAFSLVSLFLVLTSYTAEIKEKEAQIQLLHHQLESAVLEKQQFIEERASCEEDIKKFASHMHEMALYQETLRQEILRLEELREKEKQTIVPLQ